MNVTYVFWCIESPLVWVFKDKELRARQDYCHEIGLKMVKVSFFEILCLSFWSEKNIAISIYKMINQIRTSHNHSSLVWISAGEGIPCHLPYYVQTSCSKAIPWVPNKKPRKDNDSNDLLCRWLVLYFGWICVVSTLCFKILSLIPCFRLFSLSWITFCPVPDRYEIGEG